MHPARKLSDEEWEALRVVMSTDDTRTVKQICDDAGVSVGRFYVRFPGGERPDQRKRAGGEASNCQPPSEGEPGNTP